MNRVQASGFTLLEAIVANFLILLMLLTIMSVFALSRRGPADARKGNRAALLAETKLEEVRHWANMRTDNRWNFEFFGDARHDPFSETFTPEPDDPSLQYAVEGKWQLLTAGQTTLVRSARLVRVRVNWFEGTRPRQYAVETLIAEPPRPLAAIKIEPSADQHIDVGGTVSFTAQGYDADGAPIADLEYEWNVMAGTANGRLYVNNQAGTVGQSVLFKATDVAKDVDEGDCRLNVMAISAGQQKLQETVHIMVRP